MMLRFILPAPDSAHTKGMVATMAVISITLGLISQVNAANAAESSIDQDQNMIGLIGRESLSETEVIAADKTDFDHLQNDYERGVHQLQLKFAQARHDLLQQQLDKLLDRRALEMEAKARGVGTDTVLADLKVTVVTDDEARAFYDANKDRITQTYEQVAPQVRQYLTTQRTDAAIRGFYDDLRAKHGISSELAPYRVSVAATGPVRGPSTALVTIVEFGDFQCPYCKQAESSLRTILARHPQDVRLVFRNLPLMQLHPDALIAAEAAVCADQQGKFWEMHDAMYDDQGALALNSLKGTAKRLGLDGNRFSTCLTDGSTSQALDIDAKAAQTLGLTGTPYFFINGRPIDGSVPLPKLESVITDELHRAAAGSAVAVYQRSEAAARSVHRD